MSSPPSNTNTNVNAFGSDTHVFRLQGNASESLGAAFRNAKAPIMAIARRGGREAADLPAVARDRCAQVRRRRVAGRRESGDQHDEENAAPSHRNPCFN